MFKFIAAYTLSASICGDSEYIRCGVVGSPRFGPAHRVLSSLSNLSGVGGFATLLSRLPRPPQLYFHDRTICPQPPRNTSLDNKFRCNATNHELDRLPAFFDTKTHDRTTSESRNDDNAHHGSPMDRQLKPALCAGDRIKQVSSPSSVAALLSLPLAFFSLSRVHH